MQSVFNSISDASSARILNASARSRLERHPNVAASYARRILRLHVLFALIGSAVGGEAGRKLVEGMKLSTSSDALLRLIGAISSVALLACLSSFCSLLLILMMPLVQSAYELGPYNSVRSVPASSAWMLPIGVCASLPAFMPYLDP